MISHNDLINHLINSNVLHSSNIIEAFNKIDRINFVADPTVFDVYEDYPLQIGYQQTISQPSTVAMMMEMLEPQKGQKILDIGSGSGWTTALLGFIVGNSGCVTGIERVNQLVEFGNHNLEKFRFKNAKIIQAGDELGIPDEKFDRILVSAAADEFPDDLIKQLKINGKLVIPVRDSIFEITKNEDGEIKGIEHYGFRFVPLIY
ncbi:MAG: protein-L-isoaspartate O-methyltransferase [Arcobacteraceae bacterium]|nr:protein-L-isoaspartate O-methyltransferase [Arcobacteraceae bacterium]